MLNKKTQLKAFALGSAVSVAIASTLMLGGQTANAASTAGTYVFLPKSLNNPYWVDARKGMVAEAAKLGVKAQFLGPQNDDAAAQVKIFDTVLATHPLGIAVSPNDPASVISDIAKGVAAGVPIIAWDGPVPGSKVFGYIGTNNTQAGVTLGNAVAKGIGGSGNVAVIIGNLAAVNLKQRLDGVTKALAAFPNIKIVATQESHEAVADAQNASETILQAHPDLKAFIGIGGSDAPGISGALKSANKCGTIQAYGFDVVPQGIAGMQGGCIQALLSQKPFGMTAQALQILQDFHNKKSKLVKPFNIDTGVVVVTPTTLTDFLKTPH
jgi:ribose transport system substrate-binding protein